MLYTAVVAMTLAVAPRPSTEHEVHADRAARIARINSGGHTWHAKAHPRFANQAPGASVSLMGVKGDWKADVEASMARGEVHQFVPRSNAAIPDDFDSETNWPQCANVIGLIRDQSNCGCCWAFGGAEAASDRMCIASNATLALPLSDSDVCFGASFNGCGGGQITTPWTYLKSHGVVTGGLYNNSFAQETGFSGMCADFPLPHCHHHGPQGDDPWPAEGAPGCPSESSPRAPSSCDATAASPHDNFAKDKYSFTGQTQTARGEAQIQQMIMEGGPVETAFTVYEDFEDYAGGIYSHTEGRSVGGHAVEFVGWGVDNGVKYWKVKNSWNPFWGEKGYFRIKRGDNEGGIENQVIGASADATWGLMATLPVEA